MFFFFFCVHALVSKIFVSRLLALFYQGSARNVGSRLALTAWSGRLDFHSARAHPLGPATDFLPARRAPVWG